MKMQARLLLFAAVLALAAGWLALRSRNADLELRFSSTQPKEVAP